MSGAQQTLPPPNSARLAVTSLCKLLHHYGITCLEPETVRQAKFDGDVAPALWRALHDTVLVLLAGCPEGNAARTGLSRAWGAAARERDTDDFPPEAAAVVLHYLAAWGAPRGMLEALAAPPQDAGQHQHHPQPTTAPSGPGSADGPPPPPLLPTRRSRPLLLALGWLVGAAGLFGARVGALEPRPAARALLPPYPQDTCGAEHVAAAYRGAAAEARQHVGRARAPLHGGESTPAPAGQAGQQGRPRRIVGDPFSPPGGGGAGGGAGDSALWGEVEGGCQRAVALLGRVRARTVALQAASECRIRLLHSLAARQSSVSPAHRPLTAYELQLAAQPPLAQRHVESLEAATRAGLEQQELAAHGSLLFEWLGSVLQAEQEWRDAAARQAAARGQGRGGGTARRAAHAAPGSVYAVAAAAATGGPGGGGGGALASLQALPAAASPAADRLLGRLGAQLQAATQAAEPELAAARRRAAGAGAGGGGSGGGGVSMAHFMVLAEKAVAVRQDAGTPAPGGPAGLGAAAGGGGSGNFCDPTAADAGPWRLPEDLAAALAAVRHAAAQRSCTESEEDEQYRQLRYAALVHHEFARQEGGDGTFGAVGKATAGMGAGVPAAAEAQRLLGEVLGAARGLARARAAHRAALGAEVEALGEQWGLLVTGM